MKTRSAKKILNTWYKIRDFFVGWYFNKFTWEKARDYCTTPFKTWILWHLKMKYIFDPVNKDYCKHAYETWQDGGGDCEDMAQFSKEVLNKDIYDLELFRACWGKPNDHGHNCHVVLLFRVRGTKRWGYIGTGLEYSSNLQLPHIAKRMCGFNKLVKYSFVERGEKGNLLRKGIIYYD